MMTGMMDPSWLWVLALNCLQNSIMFTPCCPRAGPTGGAGLAFPAGICNLTRVLTSFAKTCPFPLQPLDLRKPQLHRSAPAKNADQDFHPPAFLIDLVHHTVEPEERSVDNAHAVPFVKFLFLAGHRCAAVDLLAERVDLLLRQGDGVRAPAHEARDLRGLLDHLPGLVRHVHFNQDIPREKFPSRGAFLAFLDLEDRKSTRLNSSHVKISYAVFCLKKK